jgi:hypothetical protein
MVFSVVGGNAEKNISANIVEALKLAKSVGARIIGVVVRRWLHAASGRCPRRGADRQFSKRYAAYRSFSGSRLARHGEPSEIAGERDEMGIGALSRPRFF